MAVNYDPALIDKVFETTEPVEVKAEKIRDSARRSARPIRSTPTRKRPRTGLTAESSRRRRSR